jgi:branched-chain amino acid transport system substrate-binding protein
MITATRLAIAGCAVLLVAVTACGSDDNGAAGATTATTQAATSVPAETPASPAGTASPETSPASVETTPPTQAGPATGEPIKIGFVSLEGGAVSLPELRIGAETAAAYINDHGGANGRPLEIVPCNVDGTPEKSIDCANRLIGGGVSVIMEGYDPSSDAMLPVLDSAGIALTGHAAFGPQQQVADNAFFFGTANPSFTAGFLDYYANNGAKTIMMFLPDNPAFRASAEDTLQPIAESLGLDLKVTFYSATPDWAALATTALAENPDVVGTVAPDGDCLALLSALRGVHYGGDIFLGACSLFLVADPTNAVGVATTSDLWKPTDLETPPADKQQELQQYIDIMTEAGHQDLINGFAWDYFSDTWNLAAVLSSINGDVTPQSISDAFRATKDLDSFMGPTITCDHSAWPGQSACGNEVLLYEAQEGGSQKAITSDFIDTSKYISFLKS